MIKVQFCNFFELTATELVGGVSAVVREVAELQSIDAFLIGARVLYHGVARMDPRRAHGHIVLVRAITAVVDAVAQLVLGDALVIGALEPPGCVALEVRCRMSR